MEKKCQGIIDLFFVVICWFSIKAVYVGSVCSLVRFIYWRTANDVHITQRGTMGSIFCIYICDERVYL